VRDSRAFESGCSVRRQPEEYGWKNKLENNSAEGKEKESQKQRGKEKKVKSKTVKNVGLDDGNWH